MDLMNRFYYEHGTQALAPLRSNQQQTIYGPPSSSSSDTNFPILAIAILGIMTTAILLVSYYVFVIKCCLNWHRFDLLRRFSFSQARRHDDPMMVYSPAVLSRGLDEVLIRAIPIIQFKKGGGESRGNEEMSFVVECAVCLNEFQEEEKLRVLPNCAHAFHIDCIDVWLQSNANCPLCRSSISIITRIHTDQIIAPTSSPQDPTPFLENTMGGDEDFVVIELKDEQSSSQASHRRQGTGISGELSVQSISPPPRKLEQRLADKKARKFHHMSSMGDECIDVREKDDQFSIQPIRRSFSMDSSADRQLYLSVQEIIQQNRHLNEVSTSTSEGCSSRVRRSFFSFGQCRGSRNAVLPIQSEP